MASQFPEPDISGLTQQLAALQAQVAGALPLGTYTVASLPTPDATNLNRLAGVTDLFGNRTTRVRCEKVTIGGVDYFYWQPQSSDSAGTIDVGSANLNLGALTMPTSVNFIGSILAGVGRTVTFADGAFPGQVKEVRMSGSIGALGSLNLLGTGLGSGVAVLLGGYQKYVSDWTTTPGTRTWVRQI
jgi:hypothetical protein